MCDTLKAKLEIWNQWLNSLKWKLRKNGNECSSENVCESFVCVEHWCRDMQRIQPKSWENVN